MKRFIFQNLPPQPTLFLVFSLLLGLLLFVHGPLGAGIMQVVSFGLLTVVCWHALRSKQSFAFVSRTQKLPFMLLAGWLGYLLIQIIPFPTTVLALISPETAEIHRQAQIDHLPGFASISLDKGASLAQFLVWASYAAIFIVAFGIARTTRGAQSLVAVLVFFAIFEMLWAISDVGRLAGGGHRLSGSFRNPNHFGSLMAVGICLGIAALLVQAKRPHQGLRAKLIAFLDGVFGSRTALLGAVALMLVGLLSSGSRGATIACIVGVLSIIILLIIRRFAQKGHDAGLRGPTAFGVLGTLAALLLWFGPGSVGNRMRSFYVGDDRARIQSSTWQMIQDFPFFGVGGGNWSNLFPKYRTSEQFTLGFDPHALNDHLEMIANQGLVGYSLFFAFCAACTWRALTLIMQRSEPQILRILLGCVAAATTLYVHAWVEYVYYVPFKGAYFFVLLAVAVAVPVPVQGHRHTTD